MTQAKYYALTGGMDLVTPAVATPPGRVKSTINYEAHPRGYQRVDGYERFDGRTKPSDAVFYTVILQNSHRTIEVDEVITGIASGATAKVLAPSEVDDVGNSRFPVVDVVGTFLINEDIRIGGVINGTLVDTVVQNVFVSLDQEINWTIAAREYFRSKIGIVPGSGPIRGIWTFNGNVYAFRDNSVATQGVMHVATANGWQPISFHSSLKFKVGTVAFVEGSQITGGTSGAKGTIRKIVLQDGDWTTDDAVGRLILSSITGTFQNNEIITATPGSATVDGVISSITLPPGGRYHFDNHNFLATDRFPRMYGVNGVGYAFEFDGTTLVPIITDEDDDKPIRVAAHKDHLFLAYSDGRVIHSSIMNPLNYEVIQGAILLGIGDTITDILPTSTGELAIFGRNKVAVLYGNNAENWQLVTLTNDSGAVPWTTQLIGSPVYLDTIGVRSLDSTQNFGNFRVGTRTQLIQPLFDMKTKAGINAVASLRVRAKDTYRLFFSDGTGVSVYFGRNPSECMMFDLGFVPTCTCSGSDVNDKEILFIGRDNGYVYQMDSGVTLDGQKISGFLRFPFNHVGSPAQYKRWQKVVVEVDTDPRTKIGIVTSFSYGDPDLVHGQESSFDVTGGGGFFDESFFEDFYWSSPVEGLAQAYIDGIGHNLSVVIISDDEFAAPHVIHGLTLYYSMRRLMM